jgi:hypothetical protein
VLLPGAAATVLLPGAATVLLPGAAATVLLPGAATVLLPGAAATVLLPGAAAAVLLPGAAAVLLPGAAAVLLPGAAAVLLSGAAAAVLLPGAAAAVLLSEAEAPVVDAGAGLTEADNEVALVMTPVTAVVVVEIRKQRLEPIGAEKPAGHTRQVVRPVFAWYVSLAQSVHAPLRLTFEKEPAAQFVHDVLPLAENVPASQS